MGKRFIINATILLLLGVAGGSVAMADSQQIEQTAIEEIATLGGGCFWCLEAVFREMEGVRFVASGYAGGQDQTPTYEEVCSGNSGHAEVVQVTFDPRVTSFKEILAVFFTIHDPTTLNRQGADVGTQYRSAVFTHSKVQEQSVREIMAELKKDGVYSRAVVTEVTPLTRFFKAEDYHQDYYRRNPTQGYCRAVIDPKLNKFREKFADKRRR
jgi:methionine-S-sulfoxide reductase